MRTRATATTFALGFGLGASFGLGTSLGLAASVSAQEMVVRGVVLGPVGTPMAIDRVVLHRVDSSGGATLAGAATTADGRFILRAPAALDTAAVYFVAARYEGELYIGQPFRSGTQGAPEQVLQVGIAANSASSLLANAEAGATLSQRARVSRQPWLFMVPLLIAAAAVALLIVPRRRIAPQRAMLIRIAQIDERLPGAPPGQRDAMRDERMRLVHQLRVG